MPTLYSFFSWFLLMFGSPVDCETDIHIDSQLNPMPIDCEITVQDPPNNPPPFVFDTNISNGI